MRHTFVRNLSRSLLLSFSAGALLAAACGGLTAMPPQMAAAAVTPELGGTVTLPDNSAKLEVPAGAVGEATMITVSTTTMSAPAGTTALGPVLKFEPDGLVFNKPVRVTFTFKSGATSPSVYWSNAAGGYDALGGMVDGSTIAADVTHFSSGFVGEGSPCAEGATCGAGSRCGVGAGGSTTGGGSGGTSTGNPTAGVDAGAPMSDPVTGSGGTSTGGPAAHTSALTADGTCCACGDDGKYHCGACGAPTADAGVPVCAEGAACQPGSGCGVSAGGGSTTSPSGSTGGSAPNTTTGGTCCSCGADGIFHCGATCPGGGDTGGVDGGTSTGTCAPGAACQPGSGCGGGSSGGACFMCTCGTDGTLVCSDCGTPSAGDAGAL